MPDKRGSIVFMKRSLFILFLFSFYHTIAQTDTTRVLFIGNSFTYTYDVPTLVQGLATAAGLPLKFVMHAPGGISVGDTSQGTSAHMNNPVVFDLIRSDNWDYVSLQDNQGRFIYGHGIFPDTNVSKVIRGHFKIRDSVKFYHPCAHMLWFAGWGPKNGYTGVSPTGSGLIDNIYQNYQYLTDTAGEIISPIGKAWKRELTVLPTVDLWGPDQTHESLAGAYLAASVIFTTIYHINTENVFFNGGLDSSAARTLRRIAYETVMDSITADNLSTYIPELTVSPTLLTATPGHVNYYWYMGGTLIGSGPTNTYTITNSGCYHVVVTDSNSCSARSAEKCIAPEITGTMTANNDMNIYPVPATDHVNIDYCADSRMVITDVSGKIVKETHIMSDHETVQIANLPWGLYLVTLYSGNSILHSKIVKHN